MNTIIQKFFFYADNILFLIIIIMATKIVIDLVTLVNEYLKQKREIDRLKKGILNLEDLHNLSPNEFEHWCALFLDKEGYTGIEVTPVGPDGGKDIICYRGSLKFYVECKRYVYSKDAKYNVDLEIARKLVGSMEGDGVVNGMIITSGIITNEAIEYINSLPECFNIKLYDGKDLLKEYDDLRKLSLAPTNT